LSVAAGACAGEADADDDSDEADVVVGGVSIGVDVKAGVDVGAGVCPVDDD